MAEVEDQGMAERIRATIEGLVVLERLDQRLIDIAGLMEVPADLVALLLGIAPVQYDSTCVAEFGVGVQPRVYSFAVISYSILFRWLYSLPILPDSSLYSLPLLRPYV